MVYKTNIDEKNWKKYYTDVKKYNDVGQVSLVYFKNWRSNQQLQDYLLSSHTKPLTVAVFAGKSLKDCLCLYFRMKEYAFTGPKPYPSEPLETMLQQALGTETVMADTEHPK